MHPNNNKALCSTWKKKEYQFLHHIFKSMSIEG